MDQIIEKIILAEITYDDFLTNGFFGTQLNNILLSDGELKWWGILLIIALGFIMVGIFEGTRSELGGIGIGCRYLVSVFLFLAVISGTAGALFIGGVEAWAILELVYIVGTWLERKKC